MKKLQVLGAGCPKCRRMAENVEAAADALGIQYRLEKVTDVNEMMKLGVVMTPALAVDGEIRIAGKVPDVEELNGILA
jgi:small redox-active disulfide protein 2